MSKFRNLSLKYKLKLLVLFPLFLLCLALLDIVVEKYFAAADSEHAYEVLELSVAAGRVVHEAQKERGLSALFLSSHGRKSGQALSEQRRVTDSAVEAYQRLAGNFATELSNSSVLGQHLQVINQRLADFSSIREHVSALDIPAAEAIGFITALNAELLTITNDLATLASNVEVSNRASAYYYLMQSKERAGIERAVLSAVLTRNKATPAEQQKYISLAVEQNTLMQAYRHFASPQMLSVTDQLLADKAVDEVRRMRKLAWDSSAGFGVNSAYWFEQSTARINLLKQAEDQLAADLKVLVSRQLSVANQLFYGLLVAGLIAVLLNVALAFAIQRQIALQTRDLVEAMTELGSHSNLRVQIKPRSRDELGSLACLFNRMVDDIRQLVGDIQQAGSTMQHTVTTMQHVSSDVHSQVQHGQDQTNMVATAMYQMATSIEQVAANCSMAADQSNETNVSAESGKKLLQKTSADVEMLDDILLQTRDVIGQVARDSEEIGGVLDVIKGVSEQTNLLALNAAIEAARAGEQGRGFAVVADEVRVLALRTQDSTLRIEEMIEKLQGGSQRAVDAMLHSQSKAEETSASIVTLVNQLSQIIDQVGTINDMNTQNAAATEQQSATVNEISENILAIQQRYSDSVSSIQRLNDTSDGMGSTSEQLALSIQRFQV